jgi:hypothetical protein
MTDLMRPRPLIYGYVRALPELDISEVLRLSSELREFSEREGFTLAEVFIERKWLHLVAWDALVTNCNRHDVRNVVVPDSTHLHTLPALSWAMQSVIEDAIGGCVWFVHPDGSEELPCPRLPRSAVP